MNLAPTAAQADIATRPAPRCELEIDGAIAAREVGLEDLARVHTATRVRGPARRCCISVNAGRNLHPDAPRVDVEIAATMRPSHRSAGVVGSTAAPRRRPRAHRQRSRGARCAAPTCGVAIFHCNDEPVGRRAAVQRAGRLAVELLAYSSHTTPSLAKFRCALSACSGSNVHSIRSKPPVERPLALGELQRRPSPLRRCSGSTPTMCDHCIALPCFTPTIEYTKPDHLAGRRRTRRSGCRRA